MAPTIKSEKTSSSSLSLTDRHKSSHSHSSSHTSSQSSPDHSSKLSKEERDVIRRRRNVQSAKRSREKRNQEHLWVQQQVLENEDRIRFLESQVESLSQELTSPRRPSSSSSSSSSRAGQWKQGERPTWFGDAF